MEASLSRTPIEIDGICEIALRTTDIERARRFYMAVLGCEQISDDHDRVWLSCGSHARIGLWTPGQKEFGDEGGSHVHLALAAPGKTMEAVIERLGEHAIEFTGPVEHSGGDRSIYFEDPDGNVVELWTFFAEGDGRRDGVDALK